MARRGHRASGFTLIELMVSVGIIGILAALAGPLFLHYSLKSKAAEAKLVMSHMRTGQETFLATNDEYANIAAQYPPGPPGADKRPWTPPPCDPTCGPKNIAVCTQFPCIGVRPRAHVYASYASPHRLGGGAQPEYAIGAIMDLDVDGDLSSWSYQSANVGGPFGAIADGISSCPIGISASTVVHCTPIVF